MNNVLHAHNGVAGWYKIEAFRVDAQGEEVPGSRRIAADWFPNLITNAGLDLLGTTGSTPVQSFCRVGSGNTAPAFTDTALVSQVAVSSTVQSDTSGVDRTGAFYGWRRRTIRFAAGTAAGTLAEVGVSATNAGPLFSRALILDGGGNPTTITVLSDEVLDVTYELRIYPAMADATGTVVIAGVTYTWTARPLNNATYDSRWGGQYLGCGVGFNTTSGNVSVYGPLVMATIPAQGSTPTSPVNGTSMNPQPYTAGSYQRSFRMDFDLNDGNVAGGIGAYFAASETNQTGGAWAWGISPKLPKTNSFKATFTVRMTWGRYTP